MGDEVSDDANSDGENDQQSVDSSFEALLFCARSGDEAATARLIDQYRDYLMFLANKKMEPNLNAKLGASDVVQQSMLAVYQNLPDFRGTSEAEFKGWIRKILQNHFLNSKRQYAKTQQRQVNQEVRLNDSQQTAPDLFDLKKSPQGHALLKEMAKELERCIGEPR